MKTPRIVALVAIAAILIALIISNGSHRPRKSASSQGYTLEVKTDTTFGK